MDHEGPILPPAKGTRLIGVTVANFHAEPTGSDALLLFGAGETIDSRGLAPMGRSVRCARHR